MNSTEYVLLGMIILSFTFTPILRKKILHEFTDEEYYIYSHIAMFVIVIIYALYLLRMNKCNLDFLTKKVTPRNAFICFLSAITGLSGSVMLAMMLKRQDVTFIVPQIQPVVILLTMIFGFIWANENISIYKIIGGSLIILGLIIINKSNTDKPL